MGRPSASSTTVSHCSPRGGLLVVSEPPTGTARWGEDLLASAGLSRIDHADARVVVLQRGSSQ